MIMMIMMKAFYLLIMKININAQNQFVKIKKMIMSYIFNPLGQFFFLPLLLTKQKKVDYYFCFSGAFEPSLLKALLEGEYIGLLGL